MKTKTERRCKTCGKVTRNVTNLCRGCERIKEVSEANRPQGYNVPEQKVVFPTDSTIHIFEKAGLGKAPFQFIGIDIRHYIPAPGIVMVGAACAYCYTGIVECCKIKSADGKQFIVGNECVKKTYDKGLINVCKTALNAERTKARHIVEDTKIAELKAWLDDEKNFQILESLNETHGSLLSEARWYLIHAGRAGKMKMWRKVKQALEQRNT